MSQIENYTATWIETPLSKFGFKCVKKFRFLTDLELQNLKSVGKKIEKKKPNKTGLDEFFWS